MRRLYRYGAVAGLDALKEAFAARLAARGFGPAGVEPASDVLVGCGATHALFCAARAILDPGDEVLVAAPYWPLAVGVLRAGGRRAGRGPADDAPLRGSRAPTPSASSRRPITPRTRALYLITPNNPDGKVYSRDAPRRHRAPRPRPRPLGPRRRGLRRLRVRRGRTRRSRASTGWPSARSRSIRSRRATRSRACASASPWARRASIAVARRVATHTIFNVPVAAQRVALAALDEPEALARRGAARLSRGEGRDAAGPRGHRARRLSCPTAGATSSSTSSRCCGAARSRSSSSAAIDRGVLLAPGDGFGARVRARGRACASRRCRAPVLSTGSPGYADAIDDLAR